MHAMFARPFAEVHTQAGQRPAAQQVTPFLGLRKAAALILILAVWVQGLCSSFLPVLSLCRALCGHDRAARC